MFQKEKLEKDINKALDSWNETSSFTLKGVRGLSRADLDTVMLYADTGGIGLRKPLGEIAKVLAKYGYVHK